MGGPLFYTVGMKFSNRDLTFKGMDAILKEQ